MKLLFCLLKMKTILSLIMFWKVEFMISKESFKTYSSLFHIKYFSPEFLLTFLLYYFPPS